MSVKVGRGLAKRRFEEIFRDGKYVRGSVCGIRSALGEGLVGYATSRKLGTKPQRNRQRRRFQAAMSALNPSFQPPLDLIIVVAPGSAAVGWGEIEQELKTLLERTGNRWESELECS